MLFVLITLETLYMHVLYTVLIIPCKRVIQGTQNNHGPVRGRSQGRGGAGSSRTATSRTKTPRTKTPRSTSPGGVAWGVVDARQAMGMVSCNETDAMAALFEFEAGDEGEKTRGGEGEREEGRRNAGGRGLFAGTTGVLFAVRRNMGAAGRCRTGSWGED